MIENVFHDKYTGFIIEKVDKLSRILEVVMKSHRKRLFIGVKTMLEDGRLSTTIEQIRREYEKNNKVETVPIFGNLLSRRSFSKFEEAVKNVSNNDSFQACINEFLHKKRVSQVLLSRRSLIKESTLSRYINGTRKPPINMVFRIILGLQLTKTEAEELLRKVQRGFQETIVDSVIIEALEQKIYDVITVEAVLRNVTNGNKSLLTQKEKEEFLDEDFEIEFID